jgi:hypothetical protein
MSAPSLTHKPTSSPLSLFPFHSRSKTRNHERRGEEERRREKRGGERGGCPLLEPYQTSTLAATLTSIELEKKLFPIVIWTGLNR